MNDVIWKAPFTIRPLVPHVDPRGALVELLRFTEQGIPGGGQVYSFTINSGKRRGDHYHHHKQEWFTCVHGRATVLLTPPEGESTACEISADAPVAIYVAPGTSHALINTCDALAVIISYGVPEHDANDPDTYEKRAFPGYAG
jgi:UDP-2-acetamido-2,6-beta-L-arabino-hexul-4-ose reductase